MRHRFLNLYLRVIYVCFKYMKVDILNMNLNPHSDFTHCSPYFVPCTILNYFHRCTARNFDDVIFNLPVVCGHLPVVALLHLSSPTIIIKDNIYKIKYFIINVKTFGVILLNDRHVCDRGKTFYSFPNILNRDHGKCNNSEISYLIIIVGA